LMAHRACRAPCAKKSGEKRCRATANGRIHLESSESLKVIRVRRTQGRRRRTDDPRRRAHAASTERGSAEAPWTKLYDFLSVLCRPSSVIRPRSRAWT
jgi:hypothetical protein